jgi:4-hydroxy-2-oxoheptanedioate aldolase
MRKSASSSTCKGLENLATIAATEGVDGIFIGPADLSAALGHRGKPNHPEVQRAIEDALQTIKQNGKAAGILMADETMARHYIELGFTFVAVGTDVGLLVKGTSALAQRFKEEPVPDTKTAPNDPSVY